MNRTVLGVIMAGIALFVIGGVVLVANSNDGKPTTTNTTEHDGEPSHTDMSSTQQSNTNSTSDSDTGQAVETVTVDIKNYAYTPATIKVKKGSKVTWTNQDSVKHDVDPDNDSPFFKESELLDKGQSYSVTFDTAGTYTYHCSPHPYMKGTVEVTE